MMLLAHVFMVPVEEIVLPLASGVGSAAVLAVTALLSPLRAKLHH